MKTIYDIYEGILDIAGTMKEGDKIDKQYKKMEVELKRIVDMCNKPTRWVRTRTYQMGYGDSCKYRWLFDCPAIFKSYDSRYKSIMISVYYDRHICTWRVEFGLSRQTNKTWSLNKSADQTIVYEFVEADNVNSDYKSNYTFEDFLKVYVVPFVCDLDALYENILKPLFNAPNHKYIYGITKNI